MFELVSADTMREIDKTASEKFGIPSLILMENAGHELFILLKEKLPPASGRELLFLCGSGNNGGDGLACARIASHNGYPAGVIMTGNPDKLSPDCRTNLEIFEKSFPGKLFWVKSLSEEMLVTHFRQASCIFDAVFGTGFKGELPDCVRKLNRLAASTHSLKIAVDVPSGICATSGNAAEDSFCADYTLALGFAKPGLFLSPALDYAGEIYLGIIGIPKAALDDFTIDTHLLSRKDVPKLLRKRLKNSHKGDYGKLLIVAGSKGMYGAPLFSSQGALRVGTGLVTLAVPAEIETLVAAKDPEIITFALAQDSDGGISSSQELGLSRFDVLLIGPGLGTLPTTRDFIRKTCENFQGTMLIDADGVNALDPEFLSKISSGKPVVFTPHLGELSRFSHTDPAEIRKDLLKFYRDFAMNHHCHIVGKGPNPFLTTPDGRTIFTRVGNPGMAVGGMGDLMAGIIAGFIAEGGTERTLSDSALLGIYFHGFLGDLTVKSTGQAPLTPTSMLSHLNEAYLELQNRN